MIRHRLTLVLLLSFAGACSQAPAPAADAAGVASTPADGAPALAGQPATAQPAAQADGAPSAAQQPPSTQVQAWTLPAGAARAAQPNLAMAGERMLLSWIERDDDGHRLRFAQAAADGSFSPARTIAEGSDWFVNWADFPSMSALANGDLVAFVLAKTAPLPYAYDLRLLRSTDGGESWSTPATVHDDGTATEHGFAALWPAGGDRVGVAWLDGRETARSDSGDPHGHSGHGAGAMTLRAAELDRSGKRAEWPLDASACDCCQTDAALTAAGPVLVYRDRTEGEVRDIAIVRLLGEGEQRRWSEPATVHGDGWVMPACPVNGPAVAAAGATVVVAWYSAAGGTPRVQLARSHDAGASFSAPVLIAEGAEVQGRVDVQLDGNDALVSWISESAEGQALWLTPVRGTNTQDMAAQAQAVAPPLRIATVAARGRASGFPRMQLHGGRAWLVWTDVVDGAPRLRGASVALDEAAATAQPRPADSL